VRQFSDDHLRELAEDPDNIVYKYEDVGDPLAPDDIVPLNTVRAVVRDLWALHPRKELKYKEADNLRRGAEKMDPRFASFSKTHPLMFDLVLGRRTTQQDVDALLYTVDLHEKTAGSANGKKKLEKYLMRTFADTPEAASTGSTPPPAPQA
jgi:hypothetical protein